MSKFIYYDKFNGISSRLITLMEKIEGQRQQALRQDQYPWYDLVLHGINTIVWFIAMMHGNTPLALLTDRFTEMMLSAPVNPLIPRFAASLQQRSNTNSNFVPSLPPPPEKNFKLLFESYTEFINSTPCIICNTTPTRRTYIGDYIFFGKGHFEAYCVKHFRWYNRINW